MALPSQSGQRRPRPQCTCLPMPTSSHAFGLLDQRWPVPLKKERKKGTVRPEQLRKKSAHGQRWSESTESYSVQFVILLNISKSTCQGPGVFLQTSLKVFLLNSLSGIESMKCDWISRPTRSHYPVRQGEDGEWLQKPQSTSEHPTEASAVIVRAPHGSLGCYRPRQGRTVTYVGGQLASQACSWNHFTSESKRAYPPL